MFDSLKKAFGSSGDAAAAGAEGGQLPEGKLDVEELEPITHESISDDQRAVVKEIITFLETQDGFRDEEAKRSMALRFAIARKFDVEAAIDSIRGKIRWEKEVQPGSIGRADLPCGLRTGLMRWSGRDRHNRFVTIIRPRLFHPWDWTDKGEYVKYVAFWMEQTLKTIMEEGAAKGEDVHYHKRVAIFDFKGWGPRNIDMEIVKQVIGISQKYYPERLALSLMINVPVVFSSFWTLIKPLLDERTAAKVHFLSAEGAANFLPKLIDVAVLEKEYGGEHEPYPVLSEKMIAEFGPNPRDIAEAEAAGVDVQTVTVGARCVETFDVAITKAGEVQWCFKGDLDVGFRCIFAATESTKATAKEDGAKGAAAAAAAAAASTTTAAATRSEQVVVVPARRAVSGAGSFTVPEEGTVQVEIDNSFSLLTGKTVKFSVVQ